MNINLKQPRSKQMQKIKVEIIEIADLPNCRVQVTSIPRSSRKTNKIKFRQNAIYIYSRNACKVLQYAFSQSGE